MRNNSVSVLGILALVAGSVGVFMLFTHRPGGAEEEEGTIETVVPVRAAKIVRTTLHGYEVAYGHVEAAPCKQDTPNARTLVRAAVDGVVVDVACQPGQVVKPGEALFRLDARLAEAEVEARSREFDLACLEKTRQEKLLAAEGTSRQDYQRAVCDFHLAEQALTAARIQLEYHTAHAPIAGTVLSVAATIGQAVQSSQPLADILDPARRVISLSVPSRTVDRIRIGQPVQIWRDKSGTWTPAGDVAYIGETIDPGNDAVEVRAELPGAIPLRPGQFAKARILCDSHADCLAVPTAALVTGPDEETYIAAFSTGCAHHVSVTRRLSEGGLVEIEGAGLVEGMDVVTEGAYGLPEQTRVDVIGH